MNGHDPLGQNGVRLETRILIAYPLSSPIAVQRDFRNTERAAALGDGGIDVVTHLLRFVVVMSILSRYSVCE